MEPSSTPWRVIESPAQEPAPPTPDGERRAASLVAVGAVLIAVVVAILALVLGARPDPVIEVDGATIVETASGGWQQATAADAGPAGTLVVEVGGAVANPGVYHLAAGSRVGDAIRAAGGFGPRVDVALADRLLNLAAPVRDGEEIHVPARGEAAAAAGSQAEPPAGGGDTLIDLNRATAQELDTLPGIGPATAAKIIAAREEQPFASVEDLGTRKVVGPATLEKIRTLVTAGP